MNEERIYSIPMMSHIPMEMGEIMQNEILRIEYALNRQRIKKNIEMSCYELIFSANKLVKTYSPDYHITIGIMEDEALNLYQEIEKNCMDLSNEDLEEQCMALLNQIEMNNSIMNIRHEINKDLCTSKELLED